MAENLPVREVVVGNAERRRRYVVCHDPHEETRQHEHRAEVLRHLETERALLTTHGKSHHPKRACELLSSRRYGRYRRGLKSGALRLDRGRVANVARLDSKWVIRTNDDTLAAEDVALGYRPRMRVEEAWRSMTSRLDMRSVFHGTEGLVRAHMALTVLALLLERAAEHTPAATPGTISATI